MPMRATVLVAALLAPQAAAAAECHFQRSDAGRIVGVQVENDVVADIDRHYTNGVRFAFVTAEKETGTLAKMQEWVKAASSYIPLFPSTEKQRVSFALGQNMYTPESIRVRPPDPNDRPYAGWLYGSAAIVSEGCNQLDILDLTVGVVGPASRAQEVQSAWHELIGSPDPKGWSYQLKDEPGVVLSWERQWRNGADPLPFGLEIDTTPHVSASLGNVFTLAAAGVTFRIGSDLPQDYGPPRIRPAAPGSDFFEPHGAFAWYLFVGGEGRVVARNIFLDGNTWKDSRSVDKEPLVGDLYAGIAVTFGRWRLTYTQTLRSPEFEEQSEFDSFGAVSVSYRF
jgi:hypothetical protein